jgi:hypothetical protein
LCITAKAAQEKIKKEKKLLQLTGGSKSVAHALKPVEINSKRAFEPKSYCVCHNSKMASFCFGNRRLA